MVRAGAGRTDVLVFGRNGTTALIFLPSIYSKRGTVNFLMRQQANRQRIVSVNAAPVDAVKQQQLRGMHERHTSEVVSLSKVIVVARPSPSCQSRRHSRRRSTRLLLEITRFWKRPPGCLPAASLTFRSPEKQLPIGQWPLILASKNWCKGQSYLPVNTGAFGEMKLCALCSVPRRLAISNVWSGGGPRGEKAS